VYAPEPSVSVFQNPPEFCHQKLLALVILMERAACALPEEPSESAAEITATDRIRKIVDRI